MKTLKDLNENSTLQDFIEFYEGIPENKWCIGEYTNPFGQHCAYGHLGTDDYNILPVESKLGKFAQGLMTVNDNINSYYKQPTPKQRVLAYLKDLTL